MTTLIWVFIAGLFVGCMLGITIAALCHMSRLAGEESGRLLENLTAQREQKNLEAGGMDHVLR